MAKVGACASAICAVHCVLTGAAFGLLSVAGLAFLREHWVELTFLGTTGLIGIWALRHGMRRHGSWIPSAFFIVGVGMVVAKHFVVGHESAGFWALFLPILGSLSLVLFFVTNARLPHKNCGCFRGTQCQHGESSSS
jgi:hypothetical protein